MAKHLVLISAATATCGVEEFARRLAAHLGADGETAVLGAVTWQAFAGAGDVVLNLPVVAWKKRLVVPVIAALRARLAGRELTIVLHEWADLAPARRISYLPLLPLATRLLFSSPEVRAQFESMPVSRVATTRRGIVPIPPNFSTPDVTTRTPRSEALAAERARGTFVLGQFGSIYPKKEPMAVLEAAAELERRGVPLKVIFVGSFIGAEVEARFNAEVTRLGLAGKVEVTGYVEDAATLYGLFAEVDAFLYPLSEGLTSRRASVLAAALSGRPVVATVPQRPDSLDHHRLFQTLLGSGALHLVRRDASAADLADAVLATRGVSTRAIDVAGASEIAWREATAAIADWPHGHGVRNREAAVRHAR